MSIFLKERLEHVLNENRKVIPNEAFREIAGRSVWIPMSFKQLYIDLYTIVEVCHVMIFEHFDFVAYRGRDEQIYILNTTGDVAKFSDHVKTTDANCFEHLETIKTIFTEIANSNDCIHFYRVVKPVVDGSSLSKYNQEFYKYLDSKSNKEYSKLTSRLADFPNHIWVSCLTLLNYIHDHHHYIFDWNLISIFRMKHEKILNQETLKDSTTTFEVDAFMINLRYYEYDHDCDDDEYDDDDDSYDWWNCQFILDVDGNLLMVNTCAPFVKPFTKMIQCVNCLINNDDAKVVYKCYNDGCNGIVNNPTIKKPKSDTENETENETIEKVFCWKCKYAMSNPIQFKKEYDEINKNLCDEIEKLKGQLDTKQAELTVIMNDQQSDYRKEIDEKLQEIENLNKQLEENRKKMERLEVKSNLDYSEFKCVIHQNEKTIDELKQKMSDMTTEFANEKKTLNDQIENQTTKIDEQSKIIVELEAKIIEKENKIDEKEKEIQECQIQYDKKCQENDYWVDAYNSSDYENEELKTSNAEKTELINELENRKKILNDQLDEVRTKLSELESKKTLANDDTPLPVEFIIKNDNTVIIPKGAMTNEKEFAFDLDQYEMSIMKMFKAGHTALSIQIVFDLLRTIGEFESSEKKIFYNRAFKYLASIGIIRLVSDKEESQYSLNSEWIPKDFYRMMVCRSGVWEYSAQNIENPYIIRDVPYKICYYDIDVRYPNNDRTMFAKMLLRIESKESIQADVLRKNIMDECSQKSGKLYYVIRSCMLNWMRSKISFRCEDVNVNLADVFNKIYVNGIESGVHFFDISKRTNDEVNDGSHFALKL